MKKKYVIIEAVLLIIIFQVILSIVGYIVNINFPDLIFIKKMANMTTMILLSVILILYVSKQKTKFSLLPKHFSKGYIICTIIFSIIIIATPSNYTGGYTAILSLVYGSIVTPVFEELIFRGYLWNRFNDVMSKEVYTYIWSVILFTLWHIGYMYPQIIIGNWFAVLTKLAAAFIYGLILGLVRIKCKNCYITMLIHSVLNTIMI